DDVVGIAARALGEIQAEPEKVVPALLNALDKPNSPGREIRKAVVRFGQAAVPALLARLKAERPVTRADAVMMLALIGAETALPQIEGLLKDADPEVRAKAARALWHIDRNAKRAVPALAEMLFDKDPAVARRAAVYLGAIGPEAKPASDKLRKLIAEAEPNVRIAAAKALWRIEGQPDAALPVLVAALKATDDAIAG